MKTLQEISEKRKEELDFGAFPANEAERIWVEYTRIHRAQLNRRRL